MKKITIYLALSLFVQTFSFAQKNAPENWFNLDEKKDHCPGVSSNRAYEEILKGKNARTVIVAVIDGGTEVAHEDLKDVIWVNEKEIAGNGIDDDGNGYIDDINGWSFISGKDSDVVEDNYELTRIYKMWKPQYDDADSTKLNAEEKKEYALYREVKETYEKDWGESSRMYETMNGILAAVKKIQEQTGSENPSLEQLKAFTPGNTSEILAKKNLELLRKKGIPTGDVIAQLNEAVKYYEKEVKYYLNTDYNSRGIVGDHYTDVSECCYGSNRVSGPKGEHGTHVAGIIGAARNNGVGMNGVAANVRLMVLRVVPDGDERDKDVANAIRYAADNGAGIINMSFGKDYSPYKKAVDDAVKYAVSKDVLLIHAAGNDGKNTDTENNFPRDQFINTTETAASWIEVGASSWHKGKNIVADFSNYGKQNVDVFAPGVSIYSTIPSSAYATYDGTSMAGPVTSGVAAIIRSYYPQLKATEVKQILMSSVTPIKSKVLMPGSDKKIKAIEISQTGGIVNAYNAVKLAEEKTKTLSSR